ncbi:hypothetical protein cyc_05667 [Cyclospora cayetanensis]|uniref:Uncharacterized protein n=1 Tax=Cyclospora cayetanensis TaxID=88456 RepID=A0A1D3D3G7_9EIME|nr:hypothetical protein cyc_05667 [Cyclospora cayetanensis]
MSKEPSSAGAFASASAERPLRENLRLRLSSSHIQAARRMPHAGKKTTGQFVRARGRGKRGARGTEGPLRRGNDDIQWSNKRFRSSGIRGNTEDEARTARISGVSAPRQLCTAQPTARVAAVCESRRGRGPRGHQESTPIITLKHATLKINH